MRRIVKVVVIGDGGVGKTTLPWVYTKQEIPPGYVPTFFENYVAKVQAGDEEVRFRL
jgi:GTPase SAR1 family protein